MFHRKIAWSIRFFGTFIDLWFQHISFLCASRRLTFAYASHTCAHRCEHTRESHVCDTRARVCALEIYSMQCVRTFRSYRYI